MECKIVEATEKDINVILLMMEKLYLELGEEKESLDFLNKKLVEEILQSGKTIILKAVTNSMEICGMLTLTESQAIYAGGKYGTIDEMYVPKVHRELNVGKKLIDKAKEIGLKKNWQRIDVTAPTENNERAVSFYEKKGFSFTGPKLKYKIQHNLTYEERVLSEY